MNRCPSTLAAPPFLKVKYGFRRIGSGTTPTTSGENYFDGDVPWVTTSELRENVITQTRQRVTQQALNDFPSLSLYGPGSVLFAMYGATIGRVAMLGIQACVNQAVCVLTDPQCFHARFAYYALQAKRDELLAEASGGGQPNLNAEVLRNVSISCPLKGEQQAIAKFLDRATAKIDAMIAAKQRLVELLEEKRQVILTQAVTRGLNPNAPMRESGAAWIGEIPQHWEITRLKFVAEVRTGITIGQKYRERDLVEYPYLRVANVQDGRLDLREVATVEVPQGETAGTMLRKGDVLMIEGGDADKLGRGCVWNEEVEGCLHQNHVFCVRPHRVSSEWLTTWTASVPSKSYFETRAKQTTNLASISGTNIKECPVVMPPVSEQNDILSYLEHAWCELDAASTAAAKSVDLLRERRRALIGEAVAGNLRVWEEK